MHHLIHDIICMYPFLYLYSYLLSLYPLFVYGKVHARCYYFDSFCLYLLTHFIIILLATHHDQVPCLTVVSWVCHLLSCSSLIFLDSYLLDTCYILGWFSCYCDMKSYMVSYLSLMSSKLIKLHCGHGEMNCGMNYIL